MNLTFYTLLVALALAGPVYGLVGITNHQMYWPGLAPVSCYASVNRYNLTCSTEVKGVLTPTPACSQENIPYLTTFAWCLAINTYNESISASTLQEYWDKVLPNATLTYPEALEAAPKPTIALSSTDKWLNDTRIVDPVYFSARYATNKAFLHQETLHAQMALSIVMLSWAVPAVGLLGRLWEASRISSLIPLSLRVFLRRHFLIPALFGTRCAQPAKVAGVEIEYIPSRALSTVILFYWAVNIAFCSAGYSVLPENLNWPGDSTRQILTYLSNRTGVLAFANIPVLLMYAGRNNLFSFITGWSPTTFLHLHRHSAYICTIEAVIHSLLYLVVYLRAPNGAGRLAEESAKPYWWWGIIATVSMCVLVVLAVLWLRRKAYEVFLAFHRILSIVVMLGSYYHIKKRYSTEWGYTYWLYAGMAVWAFDHLMRILRILWEYRVAGGGAAEVTVTNSGLIRITVDMKNPPAFTGSFYQIWFPTVFPYVASHPFTLATWYGNPKDMSEKFELKDDKLSCLKLIESPKSPSQPELPDKSSQELSEEISSDSSILVPGKPLKGTFLVKPENGTTKRLLHLAGKEAGKSLQLPVLLEGPYGTYRQFPFQNYDKVLAITGGVGFTVGLSYLSSLIAFQEKLGRRSRNPQFTLLNISRNAAQLKEIQQYYNIILAYALHPTSVHLELHDSTTQGRLELNSYVKRTLTGLRSSEMDPSGMQAPRRVAVLCAGPEGFLDDCRKTVAEEQKLLNDGVDIQFFPDEFSW